MPRVIHKSSISFNEKPKVTSQERERDRTRQKDAHLSGRTVETPAPIVVVNSQSRRAKLLAARSRQAETDHSMDQWGTTNFEVKVQSQPFIRNDIQSNQIDKHNDTQRQQKANSESAKPLITVPKSNQAKQQAQQQRQSSSESEESQKQVKPMIRPIFIQKDQREQLQRGTNNGATDSITDNFGDADEQLKRKSIKYTTKLLLQQYTNNPNNNADGSDDDQMSRESDYLQDDIPTDDDELNKELEFEQWKLREIERIKRDQNERNVYLLEQAQLDRRRGMTNEQILIENKQLGSDSTAKKQQIKYVYMQKYYNPGAFYQDTNDPIFQRDYNMPTPMELQDKSLLPSILQKRKGDFGRKGQSKYTHLTAQDTTNTNPLTKPDEALLDYWKQRTAGYKRGK